MTYPEVWVETARQIVSKPGKTLVLGESDTGKSSFTALVANFAYKKKMRVGILDLDVGQSHMGPPTTIGFAIVKAPIDQLSIIEPTSAWFVGSNSPALAISPIFEGVKMLLQRAEKFNTEYLIVDTSGWVKGKKATKFKLEIISIVSPDQIVILERNRELNQLAEEIRETAIVYRIKVPRGIKKKSKRERREFRENLWELYLNGARPLEIARSKLLNMPEFTSAGLKGTVVGLFDRNLELIGVGIVSCVNSEGVTVLTRVVREKAEWIKFGRIKVARHFLT